MSDDLKNPETIALHAGWRSDASTNSVVFQFIKQQAINLIILSMLRIYLRYLS